MRRRLSVVEYNLKYDMHKRSRPSDIAGKLLIGGTSFETEECMLRLEILPLSLNVTSGVAVADGPSVHGPWQPRCNQRPYKQWPQSHISIKICKLRSIICHSVIDE